MSALSAAEIVLREAGKPLPCREITGKALAHGYWTSKGKTPWATIAAQLYSDIKKHGAASRFILTGPDTFGLNPNPASRVARSKPTKAKKTSGRKLSFTAAAEKLLRERQDKAPVHYRDLTKQALERDLLDTQGKTPEATMYAQILTEIRRGVARGKQTRFHISKGGYLSLTDWQGTGLAFDIEQHNRSIRTKLLQRLKTLQPKAFEELIGELLARIGFEEIEVTAYSKDGGIDVRGTLLVGDVIRTRMAVQAKKWKQNVQSDAVQKLRGSLSIHEQGLIITTSDFSKKAKEESSRSSATPVALMNGEQLVALLIEHQLLVTRESHDILQLPDDVI
jgi:restriction system protein